ncbi:MAG: hypothetical protein JW987_11960 [Anaerolineaceae bacterium]|nr:hypothetical protein [Anaerolineaceae bacterium]
MEKQTATEAQSNAGTIQQIQARIVTVACLGVGLAVIAIVGGWALTGTLTDWETVVGGLFILGILAGLAALARKGRPGLAAGLLAGMLFLLVGADVAYYGLGSPSAMAFLLPVLLVALVIGLMPGLGVATLAAVVVFGVAWASLNGMIAVETLVDESHLSYNAPVVSVILLFCAGLAGTAVEAYRRKR